MNVFFILFVIFLVPSHSLAMLSLSEIMYDQEGSDSGREWLELYNGGDTTIDLRDWYLKEADSYHKLIADTPALLPPSGYAIIVQDLSYAKSFAPGVLAVKSSFSLHNEGEALVIANSEKEDQSSVQYSSALGASGNGLSLQYFNGLWQEAEPSPGYLPSSDEASGSQDSSEETSQEDADDDTPAQAPLSYRLSAKLPEYVFADNLTPFDLRVYEERGDQSSLQIRGVYRLNFGDGTAILRERYIQEDHRYRYPGDYHLVLEYYPSVVWLDGAADPLFKKEWDLTVYPPALFLEGPDPKGGISLTNELDVPLDLSSWQIQVGHLVYIFPPHSLLTGGNTFKISSDALGFFVYEDAYVQLLNPLSVHIDHLPKDDPLEPEIPPAPLDEEVEEHELIYSIPLPLSEEAPPLELSQSPPWVLILLLLVFLLLAALRIGYMKKRTLS